MLARLDAAADLMPNPELFVFMHALREATLSSQIEGTQSSMDDLLLAGANLVTASHEDDIQETLNYQKAMNHGLSRLSELPVSLRLVKEIHEHLLAGTRGQDKQPGTFRRTQNWIGDSNANLSNAAFIPPAPHDMQTALAELEDFLYDSSPMPPLIKSALIHAQFETIHPFLDGNGRVGRLLITFLLVQNEILRKPLLYPSLYFKQHRQAYYDRLQAVRDTGNWEDWVKFFLRAIAEASKDAYMRILKVLSLRENHRDLVQRTVGSRSGRVLNVLEWLYENPYSSIGDVSEAHNIGYDTASSYVSELVKLGILREMTGKRRDRFYQYEDYMKILRAESMDSSPEFEQTPTN